MNILFGCKKKVSCSAEQSEGTQEQQDGVRAEATTGISKVVPPVRVPICLTQPLWEKKHINASGFCLKCHTIVQHISLSAQEDPQPNFPAQLVQAGQPHPSASGTTGVFLGH